MADLTSTRSWPGDPDRFQPFTVTAELSSGIALGGGWGLALDGLLAAEIWAERKARLHAAGKVTTRLADIDTVEDMTLPLAICRAADGHHANTNCFSPPHSRPGQLEGGSAPWADSQVSTSGRCRPSGHRRGTSLC